MPMASQYSTEVKAQALALIRQGEPVSHAARTLGIPERTVSHWALRWREIAAKECDREILDDDYRLALRSAALMHDAYDYIAADETGERAVKALPSLNAIHGTVQDKIARHLTPTDALSDVATHAANYRVRVRRIIEEIDIG